MSDTCTEFASTQINYRTALEQTEQVIRRHSKTFYFATALLLPSERKVIRTLYAFCRASDDLVDREGTLPEAFAAWQNEVSRATERQKTLLLSWAHIRETHGLNPRFERELLAGLWLK